MLYIIYMSYEIYFHHHMITACPYDPHLDTLFLSSHIRSYISFIFHSLEIMHLHISHAISLMYLSILFAHMFLCTFKRLSTFSSMTSCIFFFIFLYNHALTYQFQFVILSYLNLVPGTYAPTCNYYHHTCTEMPSTHAFQLCLYILSSFLYFPILMF